MQDEFEEVKIETICKGIIPEMFEKQLEKILKNINDINTNPTDVRSIVFNISFKPSADRRHIDTTVTSDIKTSNKHGAKTMLFISREKGGKMRAYENNPEQLEFDNIIPIEKKTNGGN